MALTPSQVQDAAARMAGYSSAADMQASFNNMNNRATKMAPTGPAAGTAPVMSTAAAQAMGQGLSTMPSSGASDSAMSKWVSGMNNYTPPAASPASTSTPQATDPLQAELDALKAQYLSLQGSYQNALNGAFQPTYTTPTVTTPVTPTPTQITNPVPTTGVQSAQSENPDLGIPKGPGGFNFNDTGAAGASAAMSGGMKQVSPDSTYNLWKTLNGGADNDQMKQYFKSGDWAAVAAGNIPLWMSSDNSWRSLLTRLGYMSPNYNTDMQNAIQSKLASLQSQ